MIAEIMNWEYWGSIAKNIGIIASILGSAYAIKKLLLNVIIEHFKKLDVFFQKVNYIHSEVKMNGGKSIKDVVDRIEKQLGLIDARMRVSFGIMESPVYECDLSGNCIYGNKSMCDLFELDYDELLGTGWLKALHPDDREWVFDTWINCVSKKIPYECSYRLKDGRSLTTIALPMKDEVGRIYGYLGIFVDKNV